MIIFVIFWVFLPSQGLSGAEEFSKNPTLHWQLLSISLLSLQTSQVLPSEQDLHL